MAALVALLMLFALPALASAADITVNSPADGDDGDCIADCTLREAIGVATASDRVILPAGVYSVSLGDPILVEDDTIVGAGARSTIIDAAGTSRVLFVGDLTVAQISGVTVTGGDGTGNPGSSGGGGGITVEGTLTLTDSTISGNESPTVGGGIYVTVDGVLNVSGSTISGNLAQAGLNGSGGGLDAGVRAAVTVTNTTVSGNRAEDLGPSANGGQGGGIHASGDSNLTLTNVTVAGNTVDNSGGGLAFDDPDSVQLNNVVVAGNGLPACNNVASVVSLTSYGNVFQDATCNLAGPGDRQGVDALLGPLADNGGPTNTHAITAASPATGNGTACPATDQRGVARPTVCDSGAYELQSVQIAGLTVATSVVNDHGGTADPSEFRVHVRSNGADVPGSPGAPAYTLAPGSYQVAADALRGYTFTYGGACATDGTVSLAAGQSATCTVTANDPAPTLNKTVNGTPESGTIKVKLPGRDSFRTLVEGEQLPNGTIVDALKGRIELTTAASNGKVSRADFYDGIFQFKQAKGLTTLTLVQKLSCGAKGKASAAAKKVKKRRLWGDGSGKFRVKGKHSAATVVGTKWLVEDRCVSTLTKVVRGKVKVRDFEKRKTVTVRKGKQYVAKAG